MHLAIWRCCRLSCPNFHVMYLSCLVISVKCIRYCQLLFVCHFVCCYVCVLNCNGLIFTQVNKAPARSLGVCLGEDVVVLVGYMLAGPTFLLIISHSCYGGRINYCCPITIRTLAHANGSPHGRHLHRP